MRYFLVQDVSYEDVFKGSTGTKEAWKNFAPYCTVCESCALYMKDFTSWDFGAMNSKPYMMDYYNYFTKYGASKIPLSDKEIGDYPKLITAEYYGQPSYKANTAIIDGVLTVSKYNTGRVELIIATTNMLLYQSTTHL